MMKKGLFCFYLVIGTFVLQAQEKAEAWKAPAKADTLKNKYTSEVDLEKGKETYEIYCAMCHGETGLGDGAAGVGFEIPPRNFLDEDVVKQSDGALFWKLTSGRGGMAAYKDILALEDRWRLISYIREMQKPSSK